MKFIFSAIVLTLMITFSMQISSNLFLSQCDKDNIAPETCCVQAAHILALTSAAADACASAFAATFAGASISTAAAVSASVATIASAEVAFSQSLAISFNTGNCCQIDTGVKAQANASALAFAGAYAEASASATAVAAAASAATAAANSAAALIAEAYALITASCCSFSGEFYSALQIVGNFSAHAQAAAVACASASSQIQVVTSTLVNLGVQTEASTTAVVSNTINSCCSNTLVRAQANKTSSIGLALIADIDVAVGLIEAAYSAIIVIAKDADSISNCATLSDRLCTDECSAVSFSCCSNFGSCKPNIPSTVCQIGAEIATKGFLSASAKAKAVATAAAYVETGVIALTQVIVSVRAVSQAAVYVSSAVEVTVKDCCSISISVDNKVKARASAFSGAYASAQAAAAAYAQASASAAALAKASSSAIALAEASAILFANSNGCGLRCCSFRRYPAAKDCCTVLSTVVGSLSYAGAKACSIAVSNANVYIQTGIVSAASARSFSIADALARSSSKSAFMLSCCCCAKSTTTAQVSRFTGGGTSKLFGRS